MNLIKVTTKEQLDHLYQGSAWTWEGMSTSEDNLKAIAQWFQEQGCPLKEETFYLISGKTMNNAYGLTGSNKYKARLNILAIDLDNITQVEKLILTKFQVGARWFDDIVDNNRRREGFEEEDI